MLAETEAGRQHLRNDEFGMVFSITTSMLVSMITRCRRGIFVILAVSLLTAGNLFAEARSNPYGGIVDRNPFGLKPPPPPVVETNAEPAAPPPNVKLTGISNLFSKRALLEITEQQAPVRPGQAPLPGGTVNRPILAEGEEMFGVEVVAIDLEKSIVRIRNGGTESDLTFEVPKPSGGGAPGSMPPAPVGRAPVSAAAAMPPAATGQPTIISSSEPRGGVTMLGGGSGFAGNTAGVSTYGGSASPSPAAMSGGVSSYGGAAYAPGGSLASAGGTPTIPSRQLRTSTKAAQPAAQVDPETQMILMEANRMRDQQHNAGTGGTGGNRPRPPLPPTPLSQQLGGGSGPPPLPSLPR
jgi:hypothetical protein